MLNQKPIRKILPCAALAVLCGLTMTASTLARGAAKPSLGGTWQCKPNPDPCNWPGALPSITQSGNDLQIKGADGAIADGAIADAKMTSATTISAGGTFNSFGIVRPDKSIDWSDGTKWTKK
jgi:hypothetical protein